MTVPNDVELYKVTDKHGNTHWETGIELALAEHAHRNCAE